MRKVEGYNCYRVQYLDKNKVTENNLNMLKSEYVLCKDQSVIFDPAIGGVSLPDLTRLEKDDWGVLSIANNDRDSWWLAEIVTKYAVKKTYLIAAEDREELYKIASSTKNFHEIVALSKPEHFNILTLNEPE
jgi:hypothetical protein